MPLSANDLASMGWKRYHASVSANAVLTAPVRIMGIIVTGAAVSGTALIYNAATAAGTDLIGVNGAIGDSTYVGLGPNGTRFDVGVSTTLGGAGVLLDIFYTES